jgi:DNA repair protein REV1
MKVVTPDWLVESAKAGVLLPWDKFIFRLENTAVESDIRRTAQKPLFGATVQSPQSLGTSTRVKPDPAIATGYAAHKSNPHAERAMANPDWRAAHTSAAPDFIEGFYKNSRLHHLSTWKVELKKLVQEAQDRAEQGLCDNFGSTSDIKGVSMRGAELITKSPSRKGKEKAVDIKQESVIMHCDFDAFFVSAGLVDRPHLRGKPVVVCHSQGGQGGESSTSEIASASYEARKFGIKNGMRSNF